MRTILDAARFLARYLRQKGLSTVEDLEAFLESSGKSAADYRNQMKPKEARSKVIDGILASRTDCKECKPVYEKYQKIFFKKTKEKFKQEHPEVARYEKAAAYDEGQAVMASLNTQYNDIISWAEMYDTASIEAKKMIVSCLIKRVEVYRDYKLHIDFNIDFTQFCEGLDIVTIAA